MKCWGKIKSFFRPKPEAKVEEPSQPRLLKRRLGPLEGVLEIDRWDVEL